MHRREYERREHIKKDMERPRGPRREDHPHRDDMKREFKREFRKEFEREMRHRFDDGHRRPHRPHKKMVTKLFTSKEELVEYVNQKGETNCKIDIFKIEEGLYKVEIIERFKKEKEEVE